jgi:hypothetical protein
MSRTTEVGAVRLSALFKTLAGLAPGARLVGIGSAGCLRNLKQPVAFAALIGCLDSFDGRPR